MLGSPPLPWSPGRGALGGRHGISLPLVSLVPHWLVCVSLRGQRTLGSRDCNSSSAELRPCGWRNEHLSETSTKNLSVHIYFLSTGLLV